MTLATGVERGATMTRTTDPGDLKALAEATGLKVPPLIQEV